VTLLDTLRGALPKAPTKEIPTTIEQRLRRGRMEMMRDAPNRRLCVRFERGESYWYIDPKVGLVAQATVTAAGGGGKLPWRVRNKYNFIRPIITAKVSAATQRIPGFEVVPTSTDPERVGAARLAEKIALYGYDKWQLRAADVEVTFNAVGGGGEGFVLPFFNPNVGPYHPVEDPETGMTEMVGEGEIELVILNGNQVYWENGQSFMKSRWHAVERAMVVDDVEEMDGFFGDKLIPDANTSDIPTDIRPENMVMVREYFERPCPKYPDGRHLVIANGRQVVPERPYPLRDRDDKAIDEPVLHRLAWDMNNGSRRDLGLTWQLVDAQRTAQDARNKQVEWKNRCLMPQWWMHGQASPTTLTDEPGAQFIYTGQEPPKQVDVPPIPDSLEQLIRSVKQDMQEIGFDTQIEASPDVAATDGAGRRGAVRRAVGAVPARQGRFLVPADAAPAAHRVRELHGAEACGVPRPRRLGARPGFRGCAPHGRDRRQGRSRRPWWSSRARRSATCCSGSLRRSRGG
jgi:hypothetical protein